MTFSLSDIFNMRNITSILIFVFFHFSANAQIQEQGDLLFGLRGGYLTSTLHGIESSVLPIPYWQKERQYSEEYWLRKLQDGFSAEGFFHYRPPFDLPLTWDLGLSYVRLGGGLSMKVDSLSAPLPFEVYNAFIYDYFSANLMLNFHPALIWVNEQSENGWCGIRLSAGLQGGIPVPGREQVSYISNDPQEPTYKIKNVERVLADHFQSKPFWGLVGGIGYEYFWKYSGFGFCIDARVIYGLSDAILTYPHDLYHYADEKVRSIAFAGTVGLMVKIGKY